MRRRLSWSRIYRPERAADGRNREIEHANHAVSHQRTGGDADARHIDEALARAEGDVRIVKQRETRFTSGRQRDGCKQPRIRFARLSAFTVVRWPPSIPSRSINSADMLHGDDFVARWQQARSDHNGAAAGGAAARA